MMLLQQLGCRQTMFIILFFKVFDIMIVIINHDGVMIERTFFDHNFVAFIGIRSPFLPEVLEVILTIRCFCKGPGGNFGVGISISGGDNILDFKLHT